MRPAARDGHPAYGGSDSTRLRIASRSRRASGVPVGTSATPLDARVRQGPGAGDVDAARGHEAGEEHDPHGPGHQRDEERRRARGGPAASDRRCGGACGSRRTRSGRSPRRDRRREAAPRSGARSDAWSGPWPVGPVCVASSCLRGPCGCVGQASSSRTPRSSRSSSTSGPSRVTSPAPRVRTTSPGRARATRCAAVADQEGSKTTCSGSRGTAAATIAPLTPGSGSSRAT